MNSDICSKYFYYHKKHILKIKIEMKKFTNILWVQGAALQIMVSGICPILNTYIAIIRPIKDFLETFKVKKFMKKWHLDPIFGILADPKILKKLCVFSLLLYFILYLPIYVSYDRDSFSSM